MHIKTICVVNDVEWTPPWNTYWTNARTHSHIHMKSESSCIQIKDWTKRKKEINNQSETNRVESLRRVVDGSTQPFMGTEWNEEKTK